MLKKINREKIYCGLDIGSQRVKASLIKVREQNDLELLGVYESPTIGFKDSSVRDLGELSECLYRAIRGLTQKTGVSLQDIQLGIGGDMIDSRHSRTVIPLVDKGNKVITPIDIKKINHQARLLGIKMDEEMLHDFPQYYKVDDGNMAANPLGLFGRKMEVDLLLLTAEVNRLNNIIKAVNQAGYEVTNLFFNSYAAASAVVGKKIKEDGCALVDIGASKTDILIFKDGMLRHFSHLAGGGDQITSNIAEKLNLPFDLAEEIKKSYAAAVDSHSNTDEEILVKKDSGYFPIKKELIAQAVEPEVAQLLTQIKTTLESSGLYHQLNAGIVMTGGGSLLAGLIETIEKSTNLPVTLGKLILTNKGISNAAVFAAAIGLAQEGFNKEYRDKLLTVKQSGRVKGLANKLKDLYQEYF